MVKVSFRLNGHSRMVNVSDRQPPVRRKAEAGHQGPLGAPMPSVVPAILVAVGQAIKAGDVLLAIAAMKRETALMSTAPARQRGSPPPTVFS